MILPLRDGISLTPWPPAILGKILKQRQLCQSSQSRKENHRCRTIPVLRRIRNFCNGYAVVDKHGNMRYPFATPSKVREVLNWIKISFWVDPKEVNPAGLNCTNGVLQLTWEGLPPYQKPTWKLYDHTPELYYTYDPVVTYNPDADSTNCDRMLSCLDTPQREIFLR